MEVNYRFAKKEDMLGVLALIKELAVYEKSGDAVTNTVLVDLLSQPHQENRSTGHDQHRGQHPAERECPCSILEGLMDHALALDFGGH